MVVLPAASRPTETEREKVTVLFYLFYRHTRTHQYSHVLLAHESVPEAGDCQSHVCLS